MSPARVVVFSIKGRTWCFTRSIDASVSNSFSSSLPSLRDLWKKLSSNDKPITANAELVVDFVSDKVLQPSKALEELVNQGNADDGLSKCVISDICKTFGLNTHDVLKYKKSA